MIRNLVSKLPGLKCPNDYALSSLYRERAFRSLSPVQRLRSDASAVAERAASCSRAEKNRDKTGKPQARTLCFSKEYYETTQQTENESEEARWRESIPEQPNEESFTSKPDTLQFETLEQYELEAARPRPSKSREVFDAFTSKSKKMNQYVHLQPSQMKPYGSQENLYSPMLIRPTNAIKCPKKSKKIVRSSSEYQTGQRNYCTLVQDDSMRSERGQSLKFPKPTQLYPRRHPSEHWAQTQSKRLDFSPPMYQVIPSNMADPLHTDPLTISTPAMRKQRKEEANRLGSTLYKASYSDLIKLKLKNKETACKSDIVIPTEGLKVCTSCLKKPSKILEAAQDLQVTRLATRSKSNLSSKTRKYNPECQDICTPIMKTLKKTPKFPYEPQKCEKEDATPKKVYLPSKVKLSPPPCTPRPEYRDCHKPKPCGDRADMCLEITPKQLPKLVAKDCPCVEIPPPTVNPKLERLKFKFVDPPKPVCHVPPCQTPRADDGNPYKYKPLKPYVPKECECVEPPPLHGVKLKRLPKCTPEEVCRPVRVCPVVSPCPPRADECYKVVPKKLPPLMGVDCPCVEPPPPKVAPPIKRLDLRVPEPPRTCPPPPPCSLVKRADDGLKLKRKKLPKFVPGDCPCEDRPMTDWNLKRLVCEDELQECIVPDPCDSFPRADWGCWQYPDEVCEEVDAKCVDNRNPCDPPKKPKPCRKPNICETAAGGPLDYRSGSKRRFSSNSGSSMKLYQQMKLNTSSTKAPSPTVTVTTSKLEKFKGKKHPKKRTSMELIRMLDQLDISKATSTDQLLFKPKKSDKIDFKHVLKSIASCTAELEKKEDAKANAMAAQSLKKPKRPTLRVSSRAISTKQSELDLKKAKQCKAKQTCKKIKPSMKSLVNRNLCPRQLSCTDKCKSKDKRDFCPYERAPVCCEKEDSPYAAFSDNINRSVQPFIQTKTPQWTCNRKQYGFHPVYKKEHEVLGDKKKASKIPPCESKGGIKAFLTLNPLPLQLIQPYTTKIFQIKFPEPCKKPKGSEKCDKIPEEKTKHPQITCVTQDTCEATENRRCCYRDFQSSNQSRKPPPFPAFSDCLDEEMEDILTECPLDKEKYLKMQPRFEIRPPELLISPPPSQGKLDLLKEQECIRAKLCMENEGVTQSCQDFGEPLKLLKSREVFKEENRDCLVKEELKKLGRWPPRTLKSTRRSFSTAMGRIEIRNYHVLSESKKIAEKPKRLGFPTYLCERRRRFSNTHSVDMRCKGGKGDKCKLKTNKNCPKFTLNNCPPTTKRHPQCYKVSLGNDCSKPFTPYPAFSECKEHEVLPPPCGLEEMENLQPSYALLQPPTVLKEYPSQDRIDRAMAAEYRKFREGLEHEGVTIGCNLEEESKPSIECIVREHKSEKVTCCSHTPLDEFDKCMIECMKCIPCDLPEEEKYCICKVKCTKPPEPEKPKCPTKPECVAKPVVKTPPPPDPCKKIALKPCKPKPKPTNMEVLWQKVVNYFKARPNCPQPGDYKKAQLKNKAQKAAEAAGLVAVDPKCLPPDLLQDVSKECKVCPDPPKSTICTKTTRNFSTQPFRNYSSKSCKNLEEINRILEEAEIQKRKLKWSKSHSQKQFPVFTKNKTDLQAMKMSLDLEVCKYVDLSELCYENGSYSKTYFGYTNVLPSRENILERAWRISIEAYNKYNYPKNYSFFNELFTKVEKSITSAEDLEKLKTENLLRELDELLKNPDTEKK